MERNIIYIFGVICRRIPTAGILLVAAGVLDFLFTKIHALMKLAADRTFIGIGILYQPEKMKDKVAASGRRDGGQSACSSLKRRRTK